MIADSMFESDKPEYDAVDGVRRRSKLQPHEEIRVIAVGGESKWQTSSSNGNGNSLFVDSVGGDPFTHKASGLESVLELWTWQEVSIDFDHVKQVDGIDVQRLRRRKKPLPESAGPPTEHELALFREKKDRPRRMREMQAREARK